MREAGTATEWREGWPTLFAAMIAYGNGFGLFLLSSSTFILPVRQAYGWSTQQASIAPLAAMIMAVLSPFAGRLIDRWGARPFAIGGLASLSLCYIALATLPASIVLYRTMGVLIGISLVACAPVTLARGVGSWFKANRGTALGIMSSGMSIGGFLGIPFASFMILHFGWRGAYMGLAASIVVIGLPLIIFLFRERGGLRSVTTPSAAGYSLKEAFRDIRFWILLTAFLLAALPIGTISNHIIPILTGRGLSPQQAVSLGTIFAVSIGLARIGVGFLVDRLRDYAVAAACFAAAGLGAFVIVDPSGSPSVLQLQVMVCLIGLAMGVEGDLSAYFSLKFFGMRAVSAIMGCFAFAIAFGASMGGFIGSAVVDRVGEYGPLAPFVALCLLLAGIFMLSLHFKQNAPAMPGPDGTALPDR